MAEQQKFADNVELREAATAVLKKCGAEHEIWLQVQALMDSTDDTLSGAEVLEELRAIEALVRRSPHCLTKVESASLEFGERNTSVP